MTMTIPLAPLHEQRRIMTRIDELATNIEQARALKRTTLSQCTTFWKVLSRAARDNDCAITSLGDMVEFLDGQRVPLSKADRANRKGPYPYYGASGIIDQIDDFIFGEDLLLLAEDGANLIRRSTPIAFIAKGKYWVNNHAHVLRPIPGIADIGFLEYALADYDVSVFNFASAQPKLNQKNARKIAFPLPPIERQREIVEYLDIMRAKESELNELQAETSAELERLLPSILQKAFRGEL